MRRYYMELPNSDYATIKIAYDYIKKTYPYLTDGFCLCETHINSFRNGFPEHVFNWWSDDSFLGWGYKSGTKVSFPDINCIILGEIK